MSRSDAFTEAVLRESFQAVGDEMFWALGRASQSPIIYEVLDYACGLTDAQGNLLAQGNGVTGFLGLLTYTVRAVLEKFEGRLRPGDVIATNDPYIGGGTHLSDVGLVRPIFAPEDGHLIAFAASKAHWTEVGGKDPGSWTTDSTEIYQEGLQLPCIRLYRRDRPDRGMLDLIAANVRLPRMTLGDLEAQVASLRLGEARFVALCRRYGSQVVEEAAGRWLRYGRAMARIELLRLPEGTYEASDQIDDDGMGSGPLPVQVRVVLRSGRMVVDYTGSSPQVRGPINCTTTGLLSAVRSGLRTLLSSEVPINEGCFRLARVVCPPGTVFTAQRPAPVSTYWETMEYATDLMARALAPVLPERISAGHFLSVCASILATHHPRRGGLALLVEPNAGGWGAGREQDGESGLVNIGDGETYNIPVEVAEASYGVRVRAYGFNPDPGGAGRQRGGRGLVREYEVVGEPAEITASFGRHIYPPWGMEGGDTGSTSYVEVVPQRGRRWRAGKLARVRLEVGDRVRLVTGNGGGWGPAKLRERELVQRDVRAGLLTSTQARTLYGP